MTDAPGSAKPMPKLDGHTGGFYGWCRQRELRFQRCLGCGEWRHVPREMCGACGSWDWEWARSSGRGTVYTWTVVARPMHPAFAEDTPYAPTVIEMEEGVRVLSRIVDCPIEELEIGMPVEVQFEEVTADLTLPLFRRAATPGGAAPE